MKDRIEQENQLCEKKKQYEEDFKKDMGLSQKVEDHRTRLEKLIPEFYINQKTLSDDSEEEIEKRTEKSDESSELSDLDEKEKIALFDRMRTKNKFFNVKNKLANNKESLVLPFLPTRVKFDDEKNRSQSQKPITPVKNSGRFNTDLEIKNAAASKIYRLNSQPQGILESDPTILNIKKIREKFNVIKKMENSKEKILGVDLFKYDKKKWQKKNLREVNFFLITF